MQSLISRRLLTSLLVGASAALPSVIASTTSAAGESPLPNIYGRLSTDKDDPGYAYWKQLDDFYKGHVTVSLDGVLIDECTMADSVKGELLRAVTDADGRIVLDYSNNYADATVRMETLRGNVRIWLAPGETTRWQDYQGKRLLEDRVTSLQQQLADKIEQAATFAQKAHALDRALNARYGLEALSLGIPTT